MFTADLLCEGVPDGSDRSGCLLPIKGSGGAAASCLFSRDRPADQEAPSLDEPRRGTFLKETTVLRDTCGAELVALVMDQVATLRHFARKRHAREIENERQLLSCVLANGLCCHWYRVSPLVSFQRKADAQFYSKRNRPPWLSGQALGRALEGLVKADMAELLVGYRGSSSVYSLTERLLQLAQDCGVSEQSLGVHLCREDLVRLKGRRPKQTFDPITRKHIRHDAPRIYFEPDLQTEQWRDELAAYNEFVATRYITLDASEDAVGRWLASVNSDDCHRGSDLRRPELFRRAVYRVFNDATVENPTFDKGGRLAGGWWMNAPGDVRELITIDGEPTIELDYSACHPRMLYHERDLEPRSDPYDIAEVADLELSNGCEKGAYRDLVKWQMQVLINGGSRPDLVSVPKEIDVPPNAGLSDIRRFIRETHEPISSAFRSRAGLRLMNVEAEIALAIITKARQDGWLALPVHDAFIVQASRENELRTMMNDEYQWRFKHQPTIN